MKKYMVIPYQLDDKGEAVDVNAMKSIVRVKHGPFWVKILCDGKDHWRFEDAGNKTTEHLEKDGPCQCSDRKYKSLKTSKLIHEKHLNDHEIGRCPVCYEFTFADSGFPERDSKREVFSRVVCSEDHGEIGIHEMRNGRFGVFPLKASDFKPIYCDTKAARLLDEHVQPVHKIRLSKWLMVDLLPISLSAFADHGSALAALATEKKRDDRAGSDSKLIIFSRRQAEKMFGKKFILKELRGLAR